MNTGARPGGTDLLTHTTLTLDRSSSSASIADVIRALQRVPGVLFARVDATSMRATVGHDAAVPVASLLTATSGAGVRAGLLNNPFAAGRAAGDPQMTRLLAWRRMFVWAAVFAAVTLVETLTPNSPEKRWLLPALVALFWVVLLTVRVLMNRGG